MELAGTRVDVSLARELCNTLCIMSTTVPYSVHVTASELSRQITYALLELDTDLLNGSKRNVCVAAEIPYSIKTPKMREESHCRYNSESYIPPNSLSCPNHLLDVDHHPLGVQR